MQNPIFGPVCSRRLGRSLGVDLLPYKTCSYDCVYCECGTTTNLTVHRSAFFPASDVITGLDQVLESKPDLDYITFAGSGEPTLSLSLREVICHIKKCYPDYPVAVLTNSSLCRDPEVRHDLLQADLIVPTLTSTIQHTFDCIHRPAPGISVDDVIEGLISLRDEFSHQIWLELFLVPPLNTTDSELAAIRDVIRDIDPDRVQLNTLDRPGTEAWVAPVDQDRLFHIRTCLGGVGVPVDVIGACLPCAVDAGRPDAHRMLIDDILARKPSTVDEIALLTGLHRNEVGHSLIRLLREGTVYVARDPRGTLYAKK